MYYGTLIFLYIFIPFVTAPFVRHRGRQGSPVPKAVLPGGERPVPRCRTKPRSGRGCRWGKGEGTGIPFWMKK